MNRKFIFLALIISLLTSFILYGNSLKGSFVFDDDFYYLRPELRDPKHLSKIWLEPLTSVDKLELAETYRPLVVFTMSLNFITTGENTVPFHIVNVILNGLATFLLFLVVYKLFNKPVLAAFTAALFAFFPIHTEAVAFIKAREEALAATFQLTSWLFFLKIEETQGRKRAVFSIISAFFFFLGVLSKEFTLFFPAVFFIFSIFRKKISIKDSFLIAVPFAIFGAFYIYLWYVSLGGKLPLENVHTFATNPIAYAILPVRIWTALSFIFLYIGKTFVPINLSATYRYNHYPLISSPLDLKPLFGTAFLILLIILIVNKKFRSSELGLGSLIFLIAYFPFSKFFFVGGEYIAERWMYLPSAGLSVITAFFLTKIYEKKRSIALFLLMAVLVIYTIVIIPRNRVWLSPENLYKSMVEDAPESMAGNVWLARQYIFERRFSEAKPYVLKALEIYPDHNLVMGTYAAVLFSEKKYDDAEKAILKAIKIKPETSSYYFYALILNKKGLYQESQRILENFVIPKERRPEVIFLSAVNYYRVGNLAKSKLFDFNPRLSEQEKIKAINEF